MPRWLIAVLSAVVTAGLGLVVLVAVSRPSSTTGTPAAATPTPSEPETASPPPAESSAAPAIPEEPSSPDSSRTPQAQDSSGPSDTYAARRPAYVFPVAGCRADYSRSHHDYPATDIFTDVGCRFVAPVDGRVDEVGRADRWNQKTNRGADRGGLFVSIVGTDGVRYYGAHLSSVGASIRPGLQVRAGQELGRTGHTGSARPTPPHLHLGISWPSAPNHWWIRRGAIPPQPFLDAWRAGRMTSPVAAVQKARTAYGPADHCKSYC